MLGGGCIKYFMFCFNIMIMIAGIVLFSVGIVGLTMKGVEVTDEIFIDETDEDDIIGAILISVGVLTITVAMLGCFGALKESKRLLVTYVTLLVLIMLAMLMLSVINLVENHHFQRVIPAVLQLRYLQDEESFHKEYEEKYQCCGLNGPKWYMHIQKKLPSSCCAKTVTECTMVNAFAGCNDVVSNDVLDATYIMGYAALVIALVLFIGILMGAYVTWKVREAGIAGEEIVFNYKDFHKINMYGATSTIDI